MVAGIIGERDGGKNRVREGGCCLEPDGGLWERGEKIAQESEEELGSQGKEDNGGGNYESGRGDE